MAQKTDRKSSDRQPEYAGANTRSQQTSIPDEEE